MAWNTEETKRRLKQAATEEFAAHGLHGTTVDAIAKRARINKERLYNYFGSKEQLFATVLADELARIAAALPLDSLREEDIGEWAGRAYEYHATHPELLRLLHWEALAYGDQNIADEQQRTSAYRQKTDAFAHAQREGTLSRELDPDHLVFLILAITSWWWAVPQLARMITSAPIDDQAEQARRRATVIEAAQRLALPTKRH